jgi:hypothetical protein
VIEFYGGYQVYSESGVDLTMLRENLKHTATERVEENCRAIPFLAELDRSARESYPWLRDRPRLVMLDPAPLLRVLTEQQVEYVLIGGLAMRAHGSAHLTEDLDICYSRAPRNLKAIADALGPAHPYLRGAPPGLPFRLDQATLQAGLNFTLTTDFGWIDLLGEVSGIGTYEKAVAQSVEQELYGFRVHVLSLDGLIAAKRAAARIKDHGHLLELEELRKMRDAAQQAPGN